MVTLEQIKTQLRIEHDFDDEYLLFLGSAAIQICEDSLNRKLYPVSVPDDDSTGLVMNDSIRVAALLIISKLYENRSDVSEKLQHEVPMASKWILCQYRVTPS